MKRIQLGSKKVENLVCIHSILHLISWKYLGYKEVPFKGWGQCTNYDICVDKETKLDGLVQIPPITIDEEEPILENNAYLEGLLIEDL